MLKPVHQNLHGDVMHTFYADVRVCTDMIKHGMMITLHHLMSFGVCVCVCVWVCNVGWMTRACQILGAALTVFDLLHQSNTAVCCSHCRTHASFENECPLVLQLAPTETGWHSVTCAWTNPWLSSVEQHAFLQKLHGSLLMTCLLWLVVTTVRQHESDQHNITHYPTVHVVWLFFQTIIILLSVMTIMDRLKPDFPTD